jgi:hypothetical protein
MDPEDEELAQEATSGNESDFAVEKPIPTQKSSSRVGIQRKHRNPEKTAHPCSLPIGIKIASKGMVPAESKEAGGSVRATEADLIVPVGESETHGQGKEINQKSQGILHGETPISRGSGSRHTIKGNRASYDNRPNVWGDVVMFEKSRPSSSSSRNGSDDPRSSRLYSSSSTSNKKRRSEKYAASVSGSDYEPPSPSPPLADSPRVTPTPDPTFLSDLDDILSPDSAP